MTSVLQAPSFLNHIAWTRRWRDRGLSTTQAARVVALTRGAPELCLDHGLALRTLAWQAKWRGDMDGALALCEQAIEPLRMSAAQDALVDVYSILGIIYLTQYRFHDARVALSSGLDLVSYATPSETRIDLMTSYASFLSNTGRQDDAGDYLLRAQTEAKGLEQSRIQQNMARFHLLLGNIPEAGVFAARGIALSHQCNNQVILPYLHELLGASMLARGMHDMARGVIEDGLRIATADDDKRAECHLLRLLGQTDCVEGYSDQALQRFRAALRIAQGYNYSAVSQSMNGALSGTKKMKPDDAVGEKARSIARIWEQARRS